MSVPFQEQVSTATPAPPPTLCDPQPWFGLVKVPLKNGGYKGGTGTLISSDVVCTAAHVVYDDANRAVLPGATFAQGYDKVSENDVRSLATVSVTKVYVPKEYVEAIKEGRTAEPFDFAFLKLATPLQTAAQLPVPSFDSATDGSLWESDLTLYGYAGGKRPHTQTKPLRSKKDDLTAELESGNCLTPVIKTGLDSGASGGPVVIGAPAKRLIGVIGLALPREALILGNMVVIFTAGMKAHLDAAQKLFAG